MQREKSYFDGGVLQKIGWGILGGLVILVSLGILTPWAVVMMVNWETKHTVIEGRRLKFEGTAISLFGQWIKWLLLILITLGIYSFWVSIKMKQWIVKHTYFEDQVITATE